MGGPFALVIDPDDVMQRVLSGCFAADFSGVCVAGSASEARALLGERSFELVTLDVELGQDNGLDLAREVRNGCNPAIIVVSAKADRNYRIAMLNEIADDYILKPVDVHEVLARTRAVLRRRGEAPPASRAEANGSNGAGERVIRFAGYTLNAGTHQVTLPGGADVALTATEFKLLQAFVANPYRVLSRERLLDLTGDNGSVAAYDRAIDMRIQRLRSKLGGGRRPGAPDIIRTVRGFGYTFAPPDSDTAGAGRAREAQGRAGRN